MFAQELTLKVLSINLHTCSDYHAFKIPQGFSSVGVWGHTPLEIFEISMP